MLHQPHHSRNSTPVFIWKFRFPWIGYALRTILLCLLPVWVYAQESDLSFNHLGLDEGLSEQTNLYVYKDTRGFVWISSVNGLNKFDGTRIKVYTPNRLDSAAIVGENVQTGFFEDKHQRIWLATYDAINCYHPSVDSFSHYYHQYGNDSLSGYYIFYLSDSLLWMSIEGKGLFTFNIVTKKFTFISALKIFDCNKLGYITGRNGLKKIFGFDASRAHLEIISFDENQQITSDSFLKINGHVGLYPIKIISDGDSVAWIATRSSLIRMDIRTDSIWQMPLRGMLSIEHMNDSILLIGAEDDGVWKFDKRKLELVSHIRHEPSNLYSLHAGKINYISRDRDGGIWLCSTGQGLSYTFPGKKKFKILTPLATKDKTNFIPAGFSEESNGEVFCITQSGKFFLLTRQGELIREWHDPNHPDKIKKILKTTKDADNNIWLSTFNGLTLIRAERKKIEWVSTPDFISWDALELTNKQIIAGGAPLGLYKVVPYQNTFQLIRLDTTVFREEYLPHFQDSKGVIWASHHVIKIILIDADLKRTLGEVPIPGAISHLVENEPTHTMWVASSTGLYEIDTRDYTIRAIHQETVNGCTGFTNMLQDKTGRLWLTCKNQVAVFDTASKTFKVFVEEDGMPNSQFKHFGALQFNDGEMWFPFTGGFIKFHPEQIASIQIAAIPQISTFFINDQDVTTNLICEKTNARSITDIEKLTFSYQDNTIGFILNSLEYSAPLQNRVSYKMEGIDKDWIEVRSGTTVRYPELRHGNYTLLVKAANSDGIYSDMLRKIEIRITPPYYKTWWFITLLVIASLAILFYIMYLNFSKRLELERVRLRLYENLHDDVGSRLTAIVLSAEDLAQRENFKHPKLDRISGIAKSIVGNMRRLVWAIDPENDAVINLAAKIRSDKSMILGDDINFHLNVGPEILNAELKGEIRYQLLSIINEALNNISKYAQAHNVWIDLSQTGKIIHLIIRDDGVGFDVGEIKNDKIKATGYGIKNMEKRVARVNGKILVTSVPGEGTSINVKVPAR